eukprot:4133598-Prymnesium_polylepis.1
MAAMCEALGLSLPGSATGPAIDDRAADAISAGKHDEAARASDALLQLLARGVRTSDILTRPAFENAIVTLYALGGSSNSVLHLLALARAAGVPLALDEFPRIGGCAARARAAKHRTGSADRPRHTIPCTSSAAASCRHCAAWDEQAATWAAASSRRHCTPLTRGQPPPCRAAACPCCLTSHRTALT